MSVLQRFDNRNMRKVVIGVEVRCLEDGSSMFSQNVCIK
jgi:hypothetical protein